MTGFSYRDGALCADNLPVAEIAATVGTPFYCYSEGAITKQYCSYVDAFTDQDAVICYAMKANDNLAVLRTFAELGAGADVVSGGELQRALAAGIPPAKIIFSGVGKTEDELALALSSNIMQINIESFAEMELLSRVASAKGVTAEIAIRINPNVDAKTHKNISTGKAENKFGLSIKNFKVFLKTVKTFNNVKLEALSVHIGSQILNDTPFRKTLNVMSKLIKELELNLKYVDLGGGLSLIHI